VELFIQQIINGLTTGSIYVLVAIGLVLVFGVMGLPNFAHGSLYMMGAYFLLWLVVFLKINYFLSVVIAALLLAIVGIGCERFVFHPLKDKVVLSSLIAAIGLLSLFEGAIQVIFGTEYYELPPPIDKMITVLGVSTSVQRIMILVATVIIIISLHLFLKRTVTGATIEAMAQDREGAYLVGINSDRVSMITFGLAMVMAALAAALAAPILLVYPQMGQLIINKAFVILVIGGMGSLPGAIFGGYILGITESMGATYVSMYYKDLISFAVLVIFLSVRPTGLFNKGGK
jgi:branched-chain amino acid transport system permease protein